MVKLVIAQSWISSNAVWHYNYEVIGVKGFHKIEYIDDTIILNQACQYLQVINQVYWPQGPPNWNYVAGEPDTLAPQFTFMRNDTVFYFNEDKFSILYCMNAVPGQSWDLGVDTNFFTLCSKSIVNVTDKYISSINGMDMQTLVVYPNSDASVWLYGRIVHRIGSFDNYLFPQPNNCDSTIAMEFPVFYFSCFKDDDFPLVNIYDCDCDNPLALGLGEEKNRIRAFKIYPNPATDHFNLQLIPFDENAGYQLVITDLYGKQLRQSEYLSEVCRVNIAGFPKGVYLLSVWKDNSFMGCQKLIKQ